MRHDLLKTLRVTLLWQLMMLRLKQSSMCQINDVRWNCIQRHLVRWDCKTPGQPLEI